MQDFIDWLQAEMTKRDISPAELSRKGGIAASTLSHIFSAERRVGADSARKIARGLSLPEDFVMRKAGLMSPARSGDDPASLKQLIEVARTLSEQDREELIYIALGKRERRGK